MPCIFSTRLKRQIIAAARTAGATAQRWGAAQSLSDLSTAEIDQRVMWTAGRHAALQNAIAKAAEALEGIVPDR
jgi:hypothetical protein